MFGEGEGERETEHTVRDGEQKFGWNWLEQQVLRSGVHSGFIRGSAWTNSKNEIDNKEAGEEGPLSRTDEL